MNAFELTQVDHDDSQSVPGPSRKACARFTDVSLMARHSNGLSAAQRGAGISAGMLLRSPHIASLIRAVWRVLLC